MIKNKVKFDNYVNTIVIGYTADIGEEIEKKCKNVESYSI